MVDLGSSNYLKELQTAIEAAEQAGQIIDGYAQNGFDNWKKDDGSEVTEADLAAQEAIVENISQVFPKDGFLGEEDDLTSDGEERVWIIDPIDGTFNFQKNFDYYCVSIALEVDGDVKVGVVYSPETAFHELYFGVKNEGAFMAKADCSIESASKIEVSSHRTIEDCVAYTDFLNIYEGELERERSFLTELIREGGVTREGGACALVTSKVAAGRADATVAAVVKKWDYAAAKIIVEEAGGKVRVRESCFPTSYELVASNAEIHENLTEIVGDYFQ